MFRDGGVVDQLDPFGGEGSPNIEVDGRVFRRELDGTRADGRELLFRGPAVGRPVGLACLHLLTQAGHADLEELVQVPGEDAQELDALQQRVALVTRLEQDPGVELQPGQLPVQVRRVHLGTRGPLRAAGPGRTGGLCMRYGAGFDRRHQWIWTPGSVAGNEKPGRRG